MHGKHKKKNKILLILSLFEYEATSAYFRFQPNKLSYAHHTLKMETHSKTIHTKQYLKVILEIRNRK